jgi:hypothetical protein
MKSNTFGFLVLLTGILFIFGCSNSAANVPNSSTKVATENQTIFSDEFDSLDNSVWSSLPSLSPFDGFEGSNIPGEVKVENGMLKLSRYAHELSGQNPVSSIETKSTIHLPDKFSAMMRFRNEFIAVGFGNVVVEVYQHKIVVGHNGLDREMDNTYSYRYNDNSFFLLSFDVTSNGYTIKIKEDTANATEETFSKTVDFSGFTGDSTIMIWGGSNTPSAQYSEIDYLRINN